MASPNPSGGKGRGRGRGGGGKGEATDGLYAYEIIGRSRGVEKVHAAFSELKYCMVCTSKSKSNSKEKIPNSGGFTTKIVSDLQKKYSVTIQETPKQIIISGCNTDDIQLYSALFVFLLTRLGQSRRSRNVVIIHNGCFPQISKYQPCKFLTWLSSKKMNYFNYTKPLTVR